MTSLKKIYALRFEGLLLNGFAELKKKLNITFEMCVAPLEPFKRGQVQDTYEKTIPTESL